MDQKLRNRSWDKVEKKLRHSEHPYCRHPNIKYLVCMGSVMTQIFLWYTMDVQSDSRHLTPCDGCGICSLSDTSCPTQLSVPLLLQLSYFSDILQTSGRTPDIWCCMMAVVFVHFRTPHTQLSQVFLCFPFCYDSYFSNIPQTSGWLQMSDSARWLWHFFIIGQLTPNLAECSDAFPFHNVSPFLFPDLFS